MSQDLLLLSQKGGGDVSAELMEVQRKAKANGAVHHYKVLGVHSTALSADIKGAYRWGLFSACARTDCIVTMTVGATQPWCDFVCLYQAAMLLHLKGLSSSKTLLA